MCLVVPEQRVKKCYAAKVELTPTELSGLKNHSIHPKVDTIYLDTYAVIIACNSTNSFVKEISIFDPGVCDFECTW